MIAEIISDLECCVLIGFGLWCVLSNMGNHEFCVDCGESDFHYGQPCDPETKCRYQASLIANRKASIKTESVSVSVQPAWCLNLSLQQQSVLLLAGRGPDGIAKTHPCKDIQRAYRGTIFVAAKYGRCLVWGEHADSFMSLEKLANDSAWEQAVKAFFDTVDDLPHHFLLHLLHGAEILGYKHPDQRFRQRWLYFYVRGCNDMHLNVETQEQMDERLSDWSREFWF